MAGQEAPDGTGELVAAAIAGDAAAFAALTERHRRELHVHCYRMLASFDDAEDAVQDTFLRAWRGRDGFGGGGLFRAWLYRIATNVCLDALRRRAPRATVAGSFAEVPWLQPYPDRLLDEAAGPGDQPEGAAIERETIELAFVTALQVLPPRQRAALIARDVLGWPASQTAGLLEMSVAAANSALQRARATMREHLPARRADWPGDSAGRLSATERDLLAAFIDAHQRCDAAAAVAIAARDIRVTMPPYRLRYDGVAAIGPLRPATCAGPATRSSARSSSTCCAPVAGGSPRSPRSEPACSRRSACPPPSARTGPESPEQADRPAAGGCAR